MKGVVILIFILLTFIMTQCSQGYIVDMNARTNYSEGRDLYIAKCNGCHQLFNPNNFAIAKWDTIVQSMSTKAKIDLDEQRKILKWINETVDTSNQTVIKN